MSPVFVFGRFQLSASNFDACCPYERKALFYRSFSLFSLLPFWGTRYPFLCRSCRGGARPFLIRGKDAKAYQGEEPAVPLLGTSPPEIVCAKKNEVLSLCCAPISLWIASAFALQKLIRGIDMIPSFIFVDQLSCIKPHCRKGDKSGK